MRTRVGIIGLSWDMGIPLALALRDYGEHDVVCYGEPELWSQLAGEIDGPDSMPEREVRHMLETWMLPITDRMDVIAGYCDIVMVCSPPHQWQPLWLLGMTTPRVRPLPVVLCYPLLPTEVSIAWERVRPTLDIGYCPWWTTRQHALAVFTNREGEILLAGSEAVHTRFEQMWRHICNTIPIRRVPLANARLLNEGTDDRPPVPVVTSETPPAGVDNPPPPEAEEKP